MSAAAKPSTSTMVMLGIGLPALPKKLVDKIEAGEYIDFTELPPARGNHDLFYQRWKARCR